MWGVQIMLMKFLLIPARTSGVQGKFTVVMTGTVKQPKVRGTSLA